MEGVVWMAVDTEWNYENYYGFIKPLCLQNILINYYLPYYICVLHSWILKSQTATGFRVSGYTS